MSIMKCLSNKAAVMGRGKEDRSLGWAGKESRETPHPGLGGGGNQTLKRQVSQNSIYANTHN